MAISLTDLEEPEEGGPIDAVELWMDEGTPEPWNGSVVASWDGGEVPSSHMVDGLDAQEGYAFGLRTIGPGGSTDGPAVLAATLPSPGVTTLDHEDFIDLGNWEGVAPGDKVRAILAEFGKYEEGGEGRVDLKFDLFDGDPDVVSPVFSHTEENITLAPADEKIDLPEAYDAGEEWPDVVLRITALMPEGANGQRAVVYETSLAPQTNNHAAEVISHGLWASKEFLNERPDEGDNWFGEGELFDTAQAAWEDPIDLHDNDKKPEVHVMSGALVAARLWPDSTAQAHREKTADYIEQLVAEGLNTTTTALSWARSIGGFVLAADLINLAEYRPEADEAFRAFLGDMLDASNAGDGMDSLLDGAVSRPNNIGAWCRFSVTAIAAYLGEESLLNDSQEVLAFWLGDRSALPFDPFDWHSEVSWHEDPNDSDTFRGIVSQGVIRDGHNFDGIMPEDQRRGTPAAYNPSEFPNDFSGVRYLEEALGAVLGQITILRNLGVDVHLWSDEAVRRAIDRFHFFTEEHDGLGYTYFTEGHERARPLVNFHFELGLPESRSRTQLAGAARGYGWCHFLFEGVGAPPTPTAFALKPWLDGLTRATVQPGEPVEIPEAPRLALLVKFDPENDEYEEHAPKRGYARSAAISYTDPDGNGVSRPSDHVVIPPVTGDTDIIHGFALVGSATVGQGPFIAVRGVEPFVLNAASSESERTVNASDLEIRTERV